jgi:hypothetical protein
MTRYAGEVLALEYFDGARRVGRCAPDSNDRTIDSVTCSERVYRGVRFDSTLAKIGRRSFVVAKKCGMCWPVGFDA